MQSKNNTSKIHCVQKVVELIKYHICKILQCYYDNRIHRVHLSVNKRTVIYFKANIFIFYRRRKELNIMKRYFTCNHIISMCIQYLVVYAFKHIYTTFCNILCTLINIQVYESAVKVSILLHMAKT